MNQGESKNTKVLGRKAVSPWRETEGIRAEETREEGAAKVGHLMDANGDQTKLRPQLCGELFVTTQVELFVWTKQLSRYKMV